MKCQQVAALHCLPLSALRTVNDSVLFDSVVIYVEIGDFKNGVVTLAEIETLLICGRKRRCRHCRRVYQEVLILEVLKINN